MKLKFMLLALCMVSFTFANDEVNEDETTTTTTGEVVIAEEVETTTTGSTSCGCN